MLRHMTSHLHQLVDMFDSPGKRSSDAALERELDAEPDQHRTAGAE
jgi:hypothetical protein